MSNEEISSQQIEGTGSVPALSNSERIFVRLSFWQTVLSLVGVFIAVLALYAALTESQAVRQQTAAAVWPFVQMSIEDFDTGETAGFTLSFTNAGVGPALIRSVRLMVDGQAMRDWVHVIDYLGGEIDERVGRTAVSERVLSPDRTIDLISVSNPALARQFQSMIGNTQNSITYCYCSIFDDCWLADSRSPALNPEPVAVCPDFGEAGFRN